MLEREKDLVTVRVAIVELMSGSEFSFLICSSKRFRRTYIAMIVNLTYAMEFHIHQNQADVIHQPESHVFLRTRIWFWVSLGWIIQLWNRIHLSCTRCAASPLFVFRPRVLPFEPWSDQRYDVQIRFVLSVSLMFEYPMRAFMEWMSKQKNLRNLRWSGRNVARSRSSGRRSRISCASNIGFLGIGARVGVISSPWDPIFRSKPSPQLMDKIPNIGQKCFRLSMKLVSLSSLRTPWTRLVRRQLVRATRIYAKPLLGLINCFISSWNLAWRLRSPPAWFPSRQTISS